MSPMVERAWIARAALAAAVLWTPAVAGAMAPAEQSKRILSKTYTIDKKYRSMDGPTSTEQVLLESGTAPELLWITGYQATVVGPDGTSPQSQEFMCHSNLDLDMKRHAERFAWDKAASDRL